mgnify:CR=1 FL=1
MRKSYLILVSGLVQGVGFRPFVYRLAVSKGLRGFVRNRGGSEVEIRVEGEEGDLHSFIYGLYSRAPKVSRLERVTISEVEPGNFTDFQILPSERSPKERSEIPPDFAVCDECLREVLDPRDRRYRYPFNSCAFCGPRYSMMYSPPYDRENTAMREFPLCEACRREYYDPNDTRRFDAQGISCPVCGPRLVLKTVDGEVVEGDPITNAAKLVEEGKIVAIKGVGGFHISVSPFDDDAVLRLRARKRRPTKPLAIMALSSEVVAKYAEVDEVERELLESPERPIVLLKKREGSEISKYVSPGLDREGFFLFYTALHYLFLDSLKYKVAVMTSANVHGMPMCTTEECVRERLKGVVDYVLTHNREIVNRVDDSVVKVSAGRAMMIRRGRGYAPSWVRVRRQVPELVAVGAELQNAGAVAFEDKVVLTQYVGDTDELEALLDLERFLDFFVKAYHLKPRYVIADKNPAYNTTKLARKLAERFGSELVQVQHHHAHALSAMAEAGLERAVAITIDGTGYGDDGNAWGGEVLRVDGTKFERVAHLRYVPYPGGDVNALRPDRMLALFLSEAMPWSEVRKYVRLPEEELTVLGAQKRFNKLKTSSTGRFLDAVSALLDVSHERTYEGEPAIKLEAKARGGKLLDFEFPIVNGEIDTLRAFEWIMDNRDKRAEDLAFTAQYALGKALVKAALKASPEVIVVSGGAAVNEHILRGILEGSEGVRVLTNSKVPSGDGGIALGQAYFASFLEE